MDADKNPLLMTRLVAENFFVGASVWTIGP